MLEMITGALGSVLSGGVTGLLGVAVQRFADYKNRQLDIALERERRDTEIAKRKADAEVVAQEFAGRTKVAQIEGETAQEVAAAQAFAETMWSEPQRWSDSRKLTNGQMWVMVILDAFRGVVRPALTVYLCALTTYIWIQVSRELGDIQLDPEGALRIWLHVVNTVLYLTTTVVLWWFGTRNKSAPPEKG